MTVQIDIAELLITQAIEHLVAASKLVSPNHEFIEAEECIQAVILFQVAMEAIINEEIERAPLLKEVKKENLALSTKYKSLSFRNKWERAFDVLQIRKRKELKEYFNFYGRYRVLVSHPKSRYISLDQYDYENVCKGIKNGWMTIELLYMGLGKTRVSWEEMIKEVGLM
ncbi:MAG TPA: hypothetical protein PLS49_02590 [Candidatus Woesebacteria bacterium]|nr:hypothetical protein [Candidatus Woesebacteria bacterium]